MSPVFDCSTEATRREGLAKAAEALREGKLVVLPTDTLYGIGADAFNREAVERLLAAKGRGRHMPPPVLVGDVRTIDGLAIEVPDYVRGLVEAFWPGPLTVILKAQPSLTWDLGDTNGTVALRMPDDEVALLLLAEVGPMAVTSANLTGRPAATTAHEALDQLGGAVAAYLDDGPRTGGLPSTILDCTGEEPVVLRTGALSPADIRAVLGTTVLHDPADEGEEPTTGAEESTDPDPTGGVEDGDTPTETRLVGGVVPSGVRVPESSVRILSP